MSSLQAFYAGSKDSAYGLSVSVQEAGPFPVPVASNTWQPLLTSATVLPQGLWLISVNAGYTNPVSEGGYSALGVVSTVSNDPLPGTYSASSAIPTPLQTTCTFVSSAGYQSPKFVYNIDTDTLRIVSLGWTAVKLD